ADRDETLSVGGFEISAMKRREFTLVGEIMIGWLCEAVIATVGMATLSNLIFAHSDKCPEVIKESVFKLIGEQDDVQVPSGPDTDAAPAEASAGGCSADQCILIVVRREVA